MATKATLKSYFETGDVPTQAQFSELIDSLLGIEEQLADNLTTDDALMALTARQGVALKALVDSLGIRIGSIEELNTTTLGDYLLRAELGPLLDNKANINHTHLASNITDLLDLVYSKEDIDILLASHAAGEHTHKIADIEGLHTALADANNSAELASVRSDLQANIDAKSDEGHGHTESDISDLKNYLESATATLLLQTKAQVDHTHSEAEITDLDKYSKAEVDSLFAGVVSDGSVPAHTHTEANISDLDKYSKNEVDQKVADAKSTMINAHLAASNPHAIGKDDVGLGNVDNLSQIELFTNPTITGANFIGTVAGIDKNSVSLGNVPNINAVAMINAHLQDMNNPHNVDPSTFDAYTRSETDDRIETNVEIHRGIYVGDMPGGGTGTTGLITQRDIWDRIQDISYDPIGDTTTIEGDVFIDGDTEIDGSLTVESINLGQIEIYDNVVKSTVADINIEAASGNVNLNNNVVISGSLTVQGTNTTLNTQTLEVEDNIVVLNKNVTGTPALDSGIEVERGTSTNAKLYWDEASDKWSFDTAGVVKTIASAEDLSSHVSNTNNPHSVTKAQVGLGLVENTALSSWPGSENITILGTITTGSISVDYITGLHLVATSGSYLDLNNRPTTLELLSGITTATGAPGTDVTYNTTTGEFTIPKGDKGDAATIVVDRTFTGSAGSNATVINKGTLHDAILDFTIPKGNPGDAGTITIGSVSTGTSAAITNTGTAVDAVLDFTLPKGDKGDVGATFAYNSGSRTLTIST